MDIKKNAIYIKYADGLIKTDSFIQSTLPELKKIRDYKEIYYKITSKPTVEAYIERFIEQPEHEGCNTTKDKNRILFYSSNMTHAREAIDIWLKENCKKNEPGILTGVIPFNATIDESSMMIISNIYKTKEGRLEAGLYVPRYNTPQVIGGTFEKGIFKISYLHSNNFYTLEEIDKMNQQIYK